MENNNWKVGDIAICVKVGSLINSNNEGYPALRLKAEYIVNSVHKCECGYISLDVGLGLRNGSQGVDCFCGAVSSPKTGIHWASASRFVKKRTIEEVQAELESAINYEEFKYAQSLQEELDNMKQ